MTPMVETSWARPGCFPAGVPIPYPMLKVCRYRMHEWAEKISSPGVYFLVGSRGFLYVGQSENVLGRLVQHRDGWHVNTALGRHWEAAKFSYWASVSEIHVMRTKMFEQLAIEAAYITLMKPSANGKTYGQGDEVAAVALLEKFCARSVLGSSPVNTPARAFLEKKYP